MGAFIWFICGLFGLFVSGIAYLIFVVYLGLFVSGIAYLIFAPSPLAQPLGEQRPVQFRSVWVQDLLREHQEIFGADLWPYNSVVFFSAPLPRSASAFTSCRRARNNLIHASKHLVISTP